jgi:glyoxylase-like metal-dependent hydrolase (beta-lactamase superfamily II)/rhodanese-related sulfurtransferase
VRFVQVLNDDLGCASYFVADGGEALVVDPRFDVDVYEELARAARARIRFAIDTHAHADHVSGRGRLAARAGATALHPAAEEAASRIAAGDELRVGRVVLRAIATPGHRPEHLAFALTDGGRGSEPCAVLSGDSLLVGDVGRPDLAVDPHAGAAALHASVHELLGLGDHVELWPGHVGGSLCGSAALSEKTSSTLGVERRCSATLTLDRDEFIRRVAAAGKPKPPNLARVVALNRGPLDGEPAPVPLMPAAQLRGADLAALEIVDIRDAEAFDDLHLRGAVLIPAGAASATNRTAWATTPGRSLLIVAGDEARGRSFVGSLHAAGLWDVHAITLADPDAWRAAGLPVASSVAMSTADLAARLARGDLHVLDVRDEDEFAAGHIAGSTSLPLARLADGRSLSLDPRRPVAVVCARGPRAAIAASVLRRGGLTAVARLAGGGVPDLPAVGVGLVT